LRRYYGEKVQTENTYSTLLQMEDNFGPSSSASPQYWSTNS
jgi:hypothetical protein